MVTQKFGSACGSFDGTDDYLSIPDSDDWNFGSGDFTIDAWVNPTTTAVLTYFAIVNQRQGVTTNHGWGFYLYGNNQIRWTMTYNGTSQIRVDYSLPTTIKTGVWQHIAIVRNGSDLNAYLDGVQCTLTYNISTNTIFNSTEVVRVACADSSIISDYNGYIDELRISKGVARWTTGFTPPSSAYGSDANTQLLLHMDGISGDTTFIDSGNTGHTVTANNNAQLFGVPTGGFISNSDKKILSLSLGL